VGIMGILGDPWDAPWRCVAGGTLSVISRLMLFCIAASARTATWTRGETRTRRHNDGYCGFRCNTDCFTEGENGRRIL